MMVPNKAIDPREDVTTGRVAAAPAKIRKAV
jgi:hypothetical protein